MNKIRTRFPPSPTGYLHIGGARTALFNWLLARANKGAFILRIEDTDVQRSTEEATAAVLESLTWLGLDWDEGPYFQSQRIEIYLEYIERLLDFGRAYYCHCTPDELTSRREQVLKQGGKPKYDGKCRDKGLGPGPEAVVRFKGPLTGTTGWNDLIKGHIVMDNAELDDLVILRSDGLPTYNFAVVVDDLTMDITHVLRGDDHVNNTPRQILLYKALEASPPEFGHVPLILGVDRARLSKRHGATSVLAYRETGYLPEALVNYLVRLGWSFGDQEIFSREELIEKFSLDNVGRSAGIFDIEKLNWLNAHYLKEADPVRLAELVMPFLQQKGLSSPDRDYLTRAVVTLQPRAKTLDELADGAKFYLVDDDKIEYESKAARKFLKLDLTPVMADLIERVKALDAFTEKGLESLFEDLVKRHDIKLGKIAQAVRLALTGRSASPGLFEIMSILGKNRVLARLKKAQKYMAALPGA
ncbi:MAG: glutamate--tRNA ligase [Deltaproteobacteria bacterium]|nr:glutamate--tRNA ligase [Deltaproteobacteria bacterium]MBW2086683.1 glutamate--tRNA ligase [Deltaproteobacteria bacterium]